MRNSLVARISGQTPDAAAGGATWPATTGVISEVFVDKALPDGNFQQLLANLAFHELMHNKLDTSGNQPVLDDIHTQGGGGLAMATGLKASTLPPSTNLRLMATALQLDVPQLSVGLPTWTRRYRECPLASMAGPHQIHIIADYPEEQRNDSKLKSESRYSAWDEDPPQSLRWEVFEDILQFIVPALVIRAVRDWQEVSKRPPLFRS